MSGIVERTGCAGQRRKDLGMRSMYSVREEMDTHFIFLKRCPIKAKVGVTCVAPEGRAKTHEQEV